MSNEIKLSDDKMNCLILEDNDDVSTDNQNNYENEQVTFQRDKENEGFFESVFNDVKESICDCNNLDNILGQNEICLENRIGKKKEKNKEDDFEVIDNKKDEWEVI